jgi:hypothetical protein
MKATCTWSGVLLLAGFASLAHAGGPACAQALNIPLPQAPDAMGPGFYWTCPNGTTYGPNYCLRPYAPPWNPVAAAQAARQCVYPGYPNPPGCPPGMAAPGMGFPGMPGGKGGIAVFPTHPFARSPRDFFMAD